MGGLRMGLPAFVESIPDYKVKAGRMHIVLGELELVMPLKVFIEGAIRAEAEIAKWQLACMGHAEVIKLPRRH